MNSKKKYIEQMYMENYDDMLRYASIALDNSDLAQDAVQESFLIAQARADKFMASPEPRGWLFNVLKNVIGNMYKQQKKLVSVNQAMTETRDHRELEPGFGTKYKGLISDEELQMLIGVYCCGCSYAEIAERLGITLSACKKRIQRARRRFEEAINKDL